MTKTKKYEYYLIYGTRLIHKAKRKKYEEYELFEWHKMKDQNEVFERLNGVDRSEPVDSPYWIGSSSVMDTIETLTTQQAGNFMEQYQKAYEKHKSDYFVSMLEKEELDLLKRLNYRIKLENLFTPIEDYVTLPIDALHGFLLDDIESEKIQGNDYKLANRIMYFIQQFDEIYIECAYCEFKSVINTLS